ncbi:ABC transporter permease [Euzebya pacifica]|uniref:ABC transporter permease n=1 Tax=Euzebya pacifica TaxID=1608957 RepID=UPI0030F66295
MVTKRDNDALVPEGERKVLMIAAAVGGVLLLLLVWRLVTAFDGVVSWLDFVVSRPDDIIELTIEHTILTVSAMLTGAAIAIPLGVAVHRSPIGKQVALTLSSIALTIPSLALFAIFIPVVGIGFTSPYLALTIYSILPILRNTITGLDQVDPAIVEAAKGMGLSNLQRIRKVQLPLAWPVILTGIRVATVLTISIAAIATLVAGGGLGDFIKDGLARFPLPTSVERIWTGTVFIILLALVFERLFAFLTKVTTSKGLQ